MSHPTDGSMRELLLGGGSPAEGRLVGWMERLGAASRPADAIEVLAREAAAWFRADGWVAWFHRELPYEIMGEESASEWARALVESARQLAPAPQIGRRPDLVGAEGPDSWALVPLSDGEGPLGGLLVWFSSPRTFYDADRRLLDALTHYAWLALDRLRLLSAEREARRQMEAGIRIHRELGRTLDFDDTVRTVMELLHPDLADFCFFDLVDGPTVRRLARAWGDPRRQALLEASTWRSLEHPSLNLCALTTGQTAFHPVVTEAWMQQAARSPEHLQGMRELGFCSLVSVPLRHDDRLTGALNVFYASPGRRHTPADVRLLEKIARRAALAIEHTRLYAEALRLQAEAEQANRVKDDFLAMLGHELRNPLAPIATALAVIDQKADQAFQRERQVIARQLKHMTRLIDDLLDVSRISRGKIELRRRTVSLQEVVATALDMTRPVVEQRRHTLRYTSRARPCQVHGDPQRLTQVVANLVINAARYTPRGGVIEVSLEREGHEAVVAIQDSGIGMSPELIHRVFEPFHQGDASGGLGLGLTIVRMLVDLHGGSVSAASDGPGRGSTLAVRLPVVTGDVERTSDHDVLVPTTPRRILVVDDNQDAAELLGVWLEQRGHIVRVCFDPLEALRVVEVFRPEVGVLDVGMPQMDGYELARRLRRLPGLAKIRLVAVTGYGQASDQQRALDAGFDAHLVKPVPVDRLQELLVRLSSPQGGDLGARGR